jgi:hypothetical protein
MARRTWVSEEKARHFASLTIQAGRQRRAQGDNKYKSGHLVFGVMRVPRCCELLAIMNVPHLSGKHAKPALCTNVKRANDPVATDVSGGQR